MKDISSKQVSNEYGVFDSKPEWLCFEQKILPRMKSGEIVNVSLHDSFTIIPPLKKKVEVQLKTKTKIVEKSVEREAIYSCDYAFDIQTEHGLQRHIVEFKSSYTRRFSDYVLRRKLLRSLIAKWNEEAGWEKYVFEEYMEKDLIKPPKKERKKKEKKEKKEYKKKKKKTKK